MLGGRELGREGKGEISIGRERIREGEKTRQSKMKAFAFDNLTLEETHHGFCGILVVKSDQSCYNAGGVNIRRCGSWGVILRLTIPYFVSGSTSSPVLLQK